MSEVKNLTATRSEGKRLDAIDWAISDLLVIGDLLQMVSDDEPDEIDRYTITHAGTMVYERARKLKRLMAEGGAS